MNWIEVITSVERRRRWSRAEKERWVSALMEPGAVAAEVARKAGVDTSLLYRWRQQLASSREIATFVPLATNADSKTSPTDFEPVSSKSSATHFGNGFGVPETGSGN